MMRRGMKRIGAIAVAAAMSLSVVTSTTALAAGSVNAEYQKRFDSMYSKIKDTSNGYFSQEGIPYHSIETLMVEAPDYGHVTTSEAFSYYMWLEALKGKFSGDFTGFQKSWDIAEKYIIPSKDDQPETSMSKYNPESPATYAPEGETLEKYPAALDKGVSVGKDPIFSELKSAYGSSMIYGMHWILDVDNWYGFGQRGDGTSRPVYFNTFQRGEQESTWETIPQPCWDAMKFGGSNGYLDLFVKDSSYSKQFKYTNAPDADARAIQATYWANQWAKESGKSVSTQVAKASKMGDYLRYAMFDKYFKKIGSTAAGSGKDSAHYLLSWYYAWGGGVGSDWAWIIGSSHNHFGYQNPFAAWVMSNETDFKPKSSTGSTDWSKSLDRQIEFYTWLQSAEGAIAGGASNSYNGRYETWPSGTSTFYGMGYVENPVYADPGSNTWMGMQCWSMQRIAEYYYKTKDTKVKALLDKWAKWANSEIKFAADGTFQIPSTIDWDGQPETWTGSAKTNSNLHVTVVNYGTDLGVASSLANTLAYYAAASGDATSQQNAKKLLDGMWNNYLDDKGICVPEPRQDYLTRFASQKVYVPSGWTGKMPNGDPINSSSTFLSIRSKYKQDPEYNRVMAAINAGTAPVMKYHRFWAQSEFAVANGVYAILFPDDVTPPTGTAGDINADGTIDAIDLALLKTYLLKGGTIKNADMNADTSVDAIDFALLKKVLLK